MRIQAGRDRVLCLSGGGDSRGLELELPGFCNRDNGQVHWGGGRK